MLPGSPEGVEDQKRNCRCFEIDHGKESSLPWSWTDNWPDNTNCDVSEGHIGAYSSLRMTVDGSFPGRVG